MLSTENPYAPPQFDSVSDASRPKSDLENLVMSGHRFVTIPYVVSVVILSFRRGLGGVHVVKTGEWPVGKVIGATAITSLCGWWGFPFGIIWTVISLFHLWKGGSDVTRKLLVQDLGPQEASRIMASAPKPKRPGAIWLARLIILLPVILITAFIILCIVGQ
jgi:hypothetical protein